MNSNNESSRPCRAIDGFRPFGFALVLSLAACAQVDAWQKGQLAQPGMALDFEPLAAQQSQQVYLSKEGARGGDAAGGGGCGCN